MKDEKSYLESFLWLTFFQLRFIVESVSRVHDCLSDETEKIASLCHTSATKGDFTRDYLAAVKTEF